VEKIVKDWKDLKLLDLKSTKVTYCVVCKTRDNKYKIVSTHKRVENAIIKSYDNFVAKIYEPVKCGDIVNNVEIL